MKLVIQLKTMMMNDVLSSQQPNQPQLSQRKRKRQSISSQPSQQLTQDANEEFMKLLLVVPDNISVGQLRSYIIQGWEDVQGFFPIRVLESISEKSILVLNQDQCIVPNFLRISDAFVNGETISAHIYNKPLLHAQGKNKSLGTLPLASASLVSQESAPVTTSVNQVMEEQKMTPLFTEPSETPVAKRVKQDLHAESASARRRRKIKKATSQEQAANGDPMNVHDEDITTHKVVTPHDLMTFASQMMDIEPSQELYSDSRIHNGIQVEHQPVLQDSEYENEQKEQTDTEPSTPPENDEDRISSFESAVLPVVDVESTVDDSIDAGTQNDSNVNEEDQSSEEVEQSASPATQDETEESDETASDTPNENSLSKPFVDSTAITHDDAKSDEQESEDEEETDVEATQELPEFSTSFTQKTMTLEPDSIKDPVFDMNFLRQEDQASERTQVDGIDAKEENEDEESSESGDDDDGPTATQSTIAFNGSSHTLSRVRSYPSLSQIASSFSSQPRPPSPQKQKSGAVVKNDVLIEHHLNGKGGISSDDSSSESDDSEDDSDNEAKQFMASYAVKKSKKRKSILAALGDDM